MLTIDARADPLRSLVLLKTCKIRRALVKVRNVPPIIGASSQFNQAPLDCLSFTSSDSDEFVCALLVQGAQLV